MFRSLTKCAVLALALTALAMPAHAKGCIKGAVVGGAVGHYAAHHGVIGALAGCVIGRHEANKRDREQQHTQRPNSPQSNLAQ
jgi:outer membrane lipoprotein SlyB